MKKEKSSQVFNAEIEEITLIYDSKIILGSDLGHGSYPLDIIEFEIPDKDGYAVLTNVDRNRARSAYPKPKRSE